MKASRRAVGIACTIALIGGLAQGQPGSIVDRHPFQVSSPGTNGDSLDTDVGVDGDGTFTVVWEILQGDPILETDGIWARRFAATAVALGPPFRVAARIVVGPPSGIPPLEYVVPQSPSIAVKATGDSVIAWKSVGGAEPIEFRRYDAAGDPIDGVVGVDAGPGGVFVGPHVVMDADGNFLILWGGVSDGETAIRARVFNADGTPRSSRFLVKRATAPTAIGHPAVAMGSDGQFVVAWEKTVDSAAAAVRGQRFDADGMRVGPELTIAARNARTTRLLNVHVAMDAGGNFVVAYERRIDNTTFGSASLGIFARRFDAAGAPMGDEFAVSKQRAVINRGALDLAMNGAGAFALAWQSTDTPDPISPWLHTRLFDSDGSAVSGERSVMTVDQSGFGTRATSLAINDDGGHVIVWAAGFTDLFAQRVAGPQDMRPSCSYYLASLVGTDSGDVLTGTPADDVIQARAGMDWVDGAGGSDFICGGGGGDQLYGSGGADELFGGQGDDVLDGGAGTDVCDGREHINTDTAVDCETVLNVP